jgi:hypothetical protein
MRMSYEGDLSWTYKRFYSDILYGIGFMFGMNKMD